MRIFVTGATGVLGWEPGYASWREGFRAWVRG
jgi:hypothetical protein